MKTKIIILLLVIACFFSMTLSAAAHSGRTDSNGGHYDHSTGEYHYHHGNSAHQHYDIDGDGIKDCPLKFKTSSNKLTPEAIITILVFIVVLSPYAYILILPIVESNPKLSDRQAKILSIFILLLTILILLVVFLLI